MLLFYPGIKKLLSNFFILLLLILRGSIHKVKITISEAPPGEPLPSVSISVALLHLHQLGEKGSVPDHLDNSIHASNNLAGSPIIIYLPHHNSMVYVNLIHHNHD